LAFAVRWRELTLRLEIAADQVGYRIEDGADAELAFSHHGTAVTLRVGGRIELAVPPLEAGTEAPTQPAGRAPGEAFRFER
ncbi:MAG: alpha,alpha-trehalose phosphorylase, partial [Pseudonocardiales bacterium]|nr:alpha,alpha-trehalose phosphorylase [Pseudonocardiales bacterium]